MSSEPTSTSIFPGFTVEANAAASGPDFLDAALALAAVVGGITGPGAGLEAPASDLVHPGPKLVVTGRDHATWRRVEEVLVACERMLRNLSRPPLRLRSL